MVPYVIQQHIFLHEMYVKYNSAKMCWRKFLQEHPGSKILNTTGIHQLINKMRSTGSLLDKKPMMNEEKMDYLRSRLEC
jgi:hypothetical protein